MGEDAARWWLSMAVRREKEAAALKQLFTALPSRACLRVSAARSAPSRRLVPHVTNVASTLLCWLLKQEMTTSCRPVAGAVDNCHKAHMYSSTSRTLLPSDTITSQLDHTNDNYSRLRSDSPNCHNYADWKRQQQGCHWRRDHCDRHCMSMSPASHFT